ncbi:MAG: hypothetical protein ACLQVJ_12565 [Syntrophobacteraceae bacterium]
MYPRACPEPAERAERRDPACAATEGSGKSGCGPAAHRLTLQAIEESEER